MKNSPKGWAWVTEEGTRALGRLEDGTATNVTELHAIRHAIESLPASTPLHIYSDSLSSVKRIQEPEMYDDTPELRMALEIIEIIKKRPGAVTVEWVKSHKGHPLNEWADRLAKKGAKLPEVGEQK